MRKEVVYSKRYKSVVISLYFSIISVVIKYVLVLSFHFGFLTFSGAEQHYFDLELLLCEFGFRPQNINLLHNL